MYEWEYNHALNIKDALSYLFASGRIWETEYNCEEFNTQREAIKANIFIQKYENGIFKNLKKRPIPWLKINNTLHRWEGRGYNPKFIEELDKVRLSKSISDMDYERLKLLAVSFSSTPNADELFNSILRESDIRLSETEKTKLIDRYNSDEVCPGKCDNIKHNGKQYNDLFIWESIKKKAIQADGDVMFVTSDTKTDWFIDQSPRPEYIKEFQDETGKHILILTLVEFWEECKSYLDLPVEDFIVQSTIIDQLQEKYNDYYEQQICNKVEELIYETDDIKLALEDKLDCCVDLPVIDQIDECNIDDIEPSPYVYGEEYVYVTVNMTAEITFDAQNHTAGEDWSAGCDSVRFNLVAFGSIPVKWSSEDTNRIILEDNIIIDEIVDVTVIPSAYSDDDNDEDIEYYDEGMEYSDDEENFLESIDIDFLYYENDDEKY
jgi:hypothetical protein